MGDRIKHQQVSTISGREATTPAIGDVFLVVCCTIYKSSLEFQSAKVLPGPRPIGMPVEEGVAYVSCMSVCMYAWICVCVCV